MARRRNLFEAEHAAVEHYEREREHRDDAEAYDEAVSMWMFGDPRVWKGED